MEHILKYERLVSKIASEYSDYSSFEDLKQAGMIGLLKAVQKYKTDSTAKFSTYAVFWIRGEILDYLGKDKTVKISKEIIARRKEIDICSDMLRQKFGREPSISELSLYLERDEASIIEAINSKDFVLSSDYYMNEDDEGKKLTLYDTVPYYESGYDEDILTLRCAIAELSEEEQKIIQLRYFQDMSQAEVSRELGTNQVSVSRHESKILQKLKKDMVA